MMANFGGGLQRDRIYIPMAAESVPCLQRRKKYGSMMAARIIVLQRNKTYRRMMATDTLIRYIVQAHVSSWLCLRYKKAACCCSSRTITYCFSDLQTDKSKFTRLSNVPLAGLGDT